MWYFCRTSKRIKRFTCKTRLIIRKIHDTKVAPKRINFVPPDTTVRTSNRKYVNENCKYVNEKSILKLSNAQSYHVLLKAQKSSKSPQKNIII